MEKDRVKGYRTRLFDPGRHPLFNLISSPLKAILKAMTDKWRLVHDLSSPYDDTSVNSNIQMEPYHHHHFSTAMQLLIWLGPGAWFIAFDAVAAYKMPFLHPQDWHLNGEAVPGGFSFHTRPVFGSRSSGREWENIGSLAEFILRTAVQQGLPPSVAWALARYVDDYLAGFAPGAAGHAAALQACAIITQVCHDLGFPIDKCLGPRQSIRWLGLILNSVTMTAELTDVRRAFLTHLIESWTTRRSVSLKDIQRLQGHLIFATNVVDSGRFFTTSISSMLKTKRTQTIPITQGSHTRPTVVAGPPPRPLLVRHPPPTIPNHRFHHRLDRRFQVGSGVLLDHLLHVLGMASPHTTIRHVHRHRRRPHGRKQTHQHGLPRTTSCCRAYQHNWTREPRLRYLDSLRQHARSRLVAVQVLQIHGMPTPFLHTNPALPTLLHNPNDRTHKRNRQHTSRPPLTQQPERLPPIHFTVFRARPFADCPVARAYPAWADHAWECLDKALAESSKLSLSSGWKHWLRFCGLAAIHPTTQEQQHLLWFLGYLRSIPTVRAFSTYNKYFSAIRAVHLNAGIPDPFHDKPTLSRALMGLKKMLGVNTKKKRPITVDLLRQMAPHFDMNDKLDRILWSIIVIATFGLFRLGELTTTTNDRPTPLVASVTAPDSEVRYIYLEKSKVDLFGQGNQVPVGHNNFSDLNPVELIDESTKGKLPDAPLFQHPTTGQPIKRTTVVNRIKLAVAAINLPPADYSGHSCRAGGAQTLEDLGFSEDQIKELGRWRSYCWVQYRNMPVWKFRAIAKKMATHATTQRLTSIYRSA